MYKIKRNIITQRATILVPVTVEWSEWSHDNEDMRDSAISAAILVARNDVDNMYISEKRPSSPSDPVKVDEEGKSLINIQPNMSVFGDVGRDTRSDMLLCKASYVEKEKIHNLINVYDAIEKPHTTLVEQIHIAYRPAGYHRDVSVGDSASSKLFCLFDVGLSFNFQQKTAYVYELSEKKVMIDINNELSRGSNYKFVGVGSFLMRGAIAEMAKMARERALKVYGLREPDPWHEAPTPSGVVIAKVPRIASVRQLAIVNKQLY